MHTKKSTRTIINIILSILGVIWVTPAIFAILNIAKTKQEYNLGSFWVLPEGCHLMENFQSVVDSGLIQSAGASLLYAVTGAVFSVFLAMLAAYGLTHLRVRHKMFWFLFIYSGTVFPFQVYLLPIYKGYTSVGLYNTRLGMILFYTAISIPFSMFVLRNFFLGISREVCESAKIDGATDWQILMNIFLPMAKSPLSIVLLSQFTWVWNDLMFGLTFTKSAEIRPVMTTVSLMAKNNAPALFFGCIIASIPTILLFIFLQDNVEAGLAYTSK